MSLKQKPQEQMSLGLVAFRRYVIRTRLIKNVTRANGVSINVIRTSVRRKMSLEPHWEKMRLEEVSSEQMSLD